MEIFDNKLEKYFPLQFVMLGYLLAIFGLYLLIDSFNLFGIVLIIPALIFSFSKTGIQINFYLKEYKDYFFIFGLRFGKWHKLPEIEYVNIHLERYSQVINVQSISRGTIINKIIIDLIFSKTYRKNVGIFETNEKDQALETGKLLAKNLNTKLLDYTSKKPEWIKI